MPQTADNAHERLLADLNEAQRRAVLHRDGPLLIVAGPGSGKTRVVTRRAAMLALTVASPFEILAVTFTNKAAREMRERIEALAVGHGMTVSTFHSFGARLLRTYSEFAGVPENFTIFDTDDRRKVIKKAVEACDLEPSNWQPAMVERVISGAKNECRTPQEFEAAASGWRDETIARIYYAYEKLLKDNGGLDFDDLLMRPARLLHREPELREKLGKRFRYVLVDEYQDTNEAQYRMARLLSQDHRNLCVTGDPDQSIYGWRGANIENILRFERDYPGAAVVALEQNYRSTAGILAVADALIAHNEQRKEKTLWTENDSGALPRYLEAENNYDEADVIVADIDHWRREGGMLGDVAVFYRINALSRAVEESLLRAGIPYQVARGLEFYNRKEIKDVLAYIRVLVNPADEISLLRIINMPTRGIGATTVNRLISRAQRQGVGVLELITSGADLSGLGRSAGRVQAFAEVMVGLKSALTLPPAEAIEYVVSHSGLRAHYGQIRDSIEGGPIDNIDELISAAADFQRENQEATLSDWLQHVALVSDVDSVDEQTDRVTLMTLHAAKGLEFPSCYIIGLEDGLLPLRRGDLDDCDMEEERRLCFVGMTRAMERLTLSRARYRTMRGQTTRSVRSPFVDEIPEDLVDWIGDIGLVSRRSRRRGAPPIEGQLPDDIERWEVGTLVRHQDHGLGKIVAMTRRTGKTYLGVVFESGPTRTLVLEFAELERVDYDEIG